MIDEVVRKIYEEDARVRQKEMEKKQEQREYIEEFQRQQAHWNAVRSKVFRTLFYKVFQNTGGQLERAL